MKTRIKITEFGYYDIANLIAAAMYDNYLFSVSYDKNYYMAHYYNKDENLEEVCATMLTNGHSIYVNNLGVKADENYAYEKIVSYYDEDKKAMVYEISAKDITDGLERAFNGECVCSDGERSLLMECVFNLLNNTIDAPQAEMLIQVILFNEIIY